MVIRVVYYRIRKISFKLRNHLNTLNTYYGDHWAWIGDSVMPLRNASEVRNDATVAPPLSRAQRMRV